MKSVLLRLNRKFSALGWPAHHHDHCDRSAPMRLYAMHKRDFVLMFLILLAIFGACLLLGVVGPALVSLVPVDDVALNLGHSSQQMAAGPFYLKSPALSSYCRQMWIYSKFQLQQNDDEQFKKPFLVSTSVKGISDENEIADVTVSDRNYTRELSCVGEACDVVTVLHLTSLKFPLYFIKVKFFGLERVEETYRVKAVTFYCWFHHCLRPFNFQDWSVEQKWIAFLLACIVLFNDPVYPLSFLMNNQLTCFTDMLFQSTYCCLLLLFWLWVYHGIRQTERPFIKFCAPKLAVVGFLWTCELTFIFHQLCSESGSRSSIYDPAGAFFKGFKGAFIASVILYTSYLFYLILKAFSELQSMPYFAVRLRFCTFLTTVVLFANGAIFVYRAKADQAAFVTMLGGSSGHSVPVVLYYCLINLHVVVMAFAYAPPKAATFDIRVKDNPTVTMINESDDDVVYGCEPENLPLTGTWKSQSKEESD